MGGEPHGHIYKGGRHLTATSSTSRFVPQTEPCQLSPRMHPSMQLQSMGCCLKKDLPRSHFRYALYLFFWASSSVTVRGFSPILSNSAYTSISSSAPVTMRP